MTRTRRKPNSSLADRYLAALERYVAAPEEDGRAEAYDLGRLALERVDVGVVGLAAAHRGALERLVAGATATDAARTIAIAWEFFVEAVAPFEMSLRGFQAANLRLRGANEALERSRAEAESQRATLAAVVASIGDGLVVLDAGGSVSVCNDRAAELLGIAREELRRTDADALRELVAGAADDPPAVRRFLARALDRPDTRLRGEARVAGPPRRDLALEVFPLTTPDGAALGLVLRDLTAQRELDRAKDELVAVVSHELRSPLAAVSGFVELLLVRDVDAEERRRYLELVLQEARRLGGLIDDFLDLQRLDRGAARVDPLPTDLRPLLERGRAASEAEGRALVLDLPEALPDVLADPERVWQVLVNLLGNARKYSPGGGEIRLAARASPADVEVSVLDEGLGVPADALPRLFDDFYRVAAPDRESIPGTGLGLSICRKIVEAHGGRIWAESDGPGRGARFAFTLPRADRRPRR